MNLKSDVSIDKWLCYPNLPCWRTPVGASVAEGESTVNVVFNHGEIFDVSQKSNDVAYSALEMGRGGIINGGRLGKRTGMIVDRP
jgi:hypothetical protein